MKNTKVHRLLDQLCTELGFCLPPAELARLASSPLSSAEAFTDAVFVAEGLDPVTADKLLWRQVHDRVHKHFNEVEADDAA